MPAATLSPQDYPLQRSRTGATVEVALVAVFSAIALGTNYAMIALPNVKIMDSLIFMAAFLFGLRVGVGIATITWAVYGFVNPYGQAGFPLIVFLVVGECFYALAGVGLRRTKVAKQLLAERLLVSDLSLAIIFGLVGLVSTFAYDTLTNFATYMFLANSLYEAFLIGMISGVPLAILHEFSNFWFFALTTPAAIVAARRLSSSYRGIVK